jgi:hypothetical protein
MRLALSVVLIVLYTAGPARALDHVTLRRGEKEQTVSGRIVIEAQNGGVLLQQADGTLWPVEPEELVSRREDAEAFRPLARDELVKQLLAELPDGFQVYPTTHYLICHNTSRDYAAWTGVLFERLYKAFTNFWTRKGLKLREPEFPLVAVAFNTRQSYVDYSRDELGKIAASIPGYYSLRSNRVTMYDLTGIESLRGAGDRRGTTAQINLMLAQPAAEQVVATIIHEATHQIAFNCGLQTRYADIPLWVSEGIAVYFETPDLQSPRGWSTIGAVSASRLSQFREYLARRPANSLQSLVTDDKRFRDARTALDAYAEAWALNYYLIRHHPTRYVEYLRMLAEKKQFFHDDPQTRLAEFQAAFGDDLKKLDADFLRRVERLD